MEEEQDTTLQSYSNNNKLPREILDIVFKNYVGKLYAQRTLLNFRLVCKSWKYTVDNSPSLMRQMTFTIYDWRSFSQSTIIDKVKSVRIVLAWNVDVVENNTWLEFVGKLGQTVEEIIFEFCDRNDPSIWEDTTIQSSTSIISSMLTFCHRLKILAILNPAVLKALAQLPDVQLPTSIEDLDLVTNAATLKIIIFRFPNLVSITIKNDDIKNGNSGIQTILCEYVKNNNGSLKKISIGRLDQHNYHNWFRYVFTCLNRGIKLNCMEDFFELDESNIESFLSYAETPEAPVNQITCRYFEYVTMAIVERPMPTGRLGFCTNVSTIQIELNYRNRRCTLEEVMFLQKLQKLEDLFLVGRCWGIKGTELENPSFPSQVFAVGFPSLKRLEISGDNFGKSAQAFASFYLYFPNLESLELTQFAFVPAEIFMHLSKLKALREIFLTDIAHDAGYEGLIHFNDQMFTQVCQSQQAGREMDLVPAITAFRSLKKLVISGCPLLTDICVVDGIALSQTLTYVALHEIRNQLTVASIQALQHANFVYNSDIFSFFRTL